MQMKVRIQFQVRYSQHDTLVSLRTVESEGRIGAKHQDQSLNLGCSSTESESNTLKERPRFGIRNHLWKMMNTIVPS